jgi:hypothetical protein
VRPLAALTAILFGSASAIAFGLGGVTVIFLILKGRHPEMGAEFPALVRSWLVFTALAAVTGATLYSTLKELRWRWPAQIAMWASLAAVTLFYVRT